MIEEKKLSLEDKLSQYFPQIPQSKEMSIKHLLKHRTGLENFTDQKDYISFKNKNHSQAEMLEKFSKLKLDFKVGTKHEYSNTNYVLLSFIAEKVSKRNFSELVQLYLAKPLDLKNTYVFNQASPRSEEALSYSFESTWKNNTSTHESIPIGAGAIASSTRDLNKIFAALFSDKLISKKHFEEMIDMKEHYGFGLFQVPFHKMKALGHTGGIDNYRSLAMYFPEEKLMFVHLTNASEILFNDMNIAALTLYHNMEFKIPEFKNYDLSKVDLKIYEGTYSGKGFPFKITVYAKDKKLYAQASGQGAFPLEAIGKNIFEFPSAAIKMEFLPEKKTLHFTQGEKFILIKE